MKPLRNAPEGAPAPANATPEGGTGGGNSGSPRPTQNTLTPPKAPAPPPPPKAAKPPEVKAPEVKADKPAEKPADKPAPDPVEAFLAAKFDPADEIFGKEHKGLPSWEEATKHATPELKKIMSNLHSLANRRTSEADAKVRAAEQREAEARKGLEAERAQLATLGGPEFVKHLAEMRKGAEGADPFTPEGRAKLEEAKIAELFDKMIAPVRQKLEVEASRARFDAYVASNPDIKDPEIRKEVGQLLQRHEHLTLEDAHNLVKGRRASKELADLKAKEEEDRKNRADVLGSTGPTGIRGDGSKKLRFKSMEEAFEHHRSQGMR